MEEKTLFILSQNWENRGFMSWQEGGTSSKTKSFYHTMPSTFLLPWLCAEGHKKPFMAFYGCNREFQKQKFHQFWTCLHKEKLQIEKRQLILECTSITATSMWSPVSSCLLRLSLGVSFEWHCTGPRCCATEDNILRVASDPSVSSKGNCVGNFAFACGALS